MLTQNPNWIVTNIDDLLDVYHELLRGIDSPRALTCGLLVQAGEWDQLLDLKTDPLHYCDFITGGALPGVIQFRHDYQATSFLRKCSDLPLTVDRKAVAIDGFWETEAQCFATNRRLTQFLEFDLGLTDLDEPEYRAICKFLAAVRKNVSSVLGQLPNQIKPKFGPGSIYESKGFRYASSIVLPDKLDKIVPAVTPHARMLFDHYFWPSAWGRVWVQRFGSPNVVNSNRFTTVPKDATKDRGICVEPGGNVWLQLGVGQYIRRRLRDNLGLLLDSGRSESIHHQLAKAGSESGVYATMDLKSASDTVARILIRLLFPPAWTVLLESLRSPFTEIEGRRVYLEKFSSMGNGFTFEIETLIFAAVVKAVCDIECPSGVWSVYGDDIIVPTECAASVAAALKFMGFTLNTNKTFVSSAFRESCGGDYFAGELVRPFFIKEESPHEPQHWISVVNGLRRSSGTTAESAGPYHMAWKRALQHIPASIRKCEGPTWLGDLCIHRRNPRGQERHGILGYRTWQPVFKHRSLRLYDPQAQLAYALSGGDSQGPTPRGDYGISGYHVKWTFLPKTRVKAQAFTDQGEVVLSWLKSPPPPPPPESSPDVLAEVRVRAYGRVMLLSLIHI